MVVLVPILGVRFLSVHSKRYYPGREDVFLLERLTGITFLLLPITSVMLVYSSSVNLLFQEI